MKETLSTLIIILMFLSCKREKKKFSIPKVLDSVPVTSNLIHSKKMLEGGYELIGISKDSIFEIKDIENKRQKYFLSFVKFISRYEDEVEDTTDIVKETIIPPPPPPKPDFNSNIPKNNNIKIFVDSSQILNIPDYTDNIEINKKMEEGITGTYKDYYENSKNSLNKYFNPSKKQKQGYPIFIFNKSDTIFNVDLKEGWVKMIQEAVDKNGKWKPIEYYDPQAICGNSFAYKPLLPDYYALSKIYRYNGNFKTKIRVKLISQNNTYYSNEFSGAINLNQFKIPALINNREESERKVYFLEDK